jgi:MFS family permease
MKHNSVIVVNNNDRLEIRDLIIINVFSGVVSSLLTDRIGRRPLLIISYFGTGLSLSVTGAYFFGLEILKIDEEIISPYGVVAFAGIIFSVILSTIGYNSLIYVIPAELFPMNVKSVAMTFLNFFGGFSNFAIIKLYQQMINQFGLFGVFALFSVVSIIGGIFSYLTVPETKGKSLREILLLLQGEEYTEDAENLNKPVKLEVEANGANDATELQLLNSKQTQ